MESIKFIDEDAYYWLDDIPTRHWCRHAFTTNCKSNMLLNNLCETFNSVLKPARDKPILTQMESMRRYMMKRNTEKWEAIQKLTCKVMPYVSKVLDGLECEVRNCIVQVSRGNTYEVEHRRDQVMVDLDCRTCSCYHWQHTGFPCVHAYACMMDKRVDPVDYVNNYYSRETYLLAYVPAINPMPGRQHWEKTNLRQPLPPAIRVMPGRPKSKKRKKEKGEEEEKHPKRPRSKKTCGNCGGKRHNKKTCRKCSAAPPQPKPKTGRPPLDNAWVNEQRKKKEVRAKMKYQPQQPATSAAEQVTQPHPSSQTGSTTTQQLTQPQPSSRGKLAIKSSKKKQIATNLELN